MFTIRIASAVKSIPIILNSQVSFILNSVINRTMVGWEEEKEKFLSMGLDEKRRSYSSQKYIKIEDIPTWTEFAGKQKLSDEEIKVQCKIDSTKNALLSQKVSLFMGDITTLEIDAIVNAANSSLLGGGGVDGAIHRAAGASLKEECRTLKHCPTGQAKLTGGYRLPAKYVIHTVGPQGEKPDLLSQCYKNSLNIMQAKKLRTIAFPCISTGIYGYPIKPAAHVAISEVRKHLEANPDNVERVIFCLFTPEDKEIYPNLLKSYFPLQ